MSFGCPCPFTCVNRSLIFANHPFTSIHSWSVISFAFVFFLFRSAPVLLVELSLHSDELSIQSVEPEANGSGTMELRRRRCFVRVPFAALAFTTLEGTLAELGLLDSIAEVTVLTGRLVVGLVRGVFTGVAVGFETIEAAPNFDEPPCHFTCFEGSLTGSCVLKF